MQHTQKVAFPKVISGLIPDVLCSCFPQLNGLYISWSSIEVSMTDLDKADVEAMTSLLLLIKKSETLRIEVRDCLLDVSVAPFLHH